MTTLEVLGDIYRTLPEDAASTWEKESKAGLDETVTNFQTPEKNSWDI